MIGCRCFDQQGCGDWLRGHLWKPAWVLLLLLLVVVMALLLLLLLWMLWMQRQRCVMCGQ